MDASTAEPESRWLLRWLDWGLVVLFGVLVSLAFLNDWSLGRLGNAYQLVGLCFAALALPVLSPWLASAEVRIGEQRQATKRWLTQRREQLRILWARIRRKRIDTIVHVGPASELSGAGGLTAVGHSGVDRENIGEREWLAYLNGQLDVLKERVRLLETGREADRKQVDDKLDALRVELQEHTLAVTREGWDYIASGAFLTGIGIVLTLI